MGKDKAPAAAKSSGKGKAKKKWSKGKTREALDNLVLFPKDQFKKFIEEVPNTSVITVATISERFKINGSLARRALRYLVAHKKIKRIAKGGGFILYTKVTAASAAAAEADAKDAKDAKKGGKKEKKGKEAPAAEADAEASDAVEASA